MITKNSGSVINSCLGLKGVPHLWIYRDNREFEYCPQQIQTIRLDRLDITVCSLTEFLRGIYKHLGWMGKEENKGRKGRREVYRWWARIWIGWIGDLSFEAKEKLK